ncbi:MAG TPA: acyloxyacyl hydrolase, partial [Pseudomonas sp.]|nr:acyloxyacyl hydrolase [Pseudomonas sp.]
MNKLISLGLAAALGVMPFAGAHAMGITGAVGATGESTMTYR